MRLIAAAVVALFLSACGGGVRIVPADQLPQEIYGADVVLDEREVSVTVYFVQDGQVPLRLAAVTRSGVTDLSPEHFAVEELFRGPPSDLVTAIPRDIELLAITVEDGLARVNLPAEWERTTEDEIVQLQIAQVVYTLTEFAHIDRVAFRVRLVSRQVVTPSGQVLNEVGRGHFAEFAPRASGTEVESGSITD